LSWQKPLSPPTNGPAPRLPAIRNHLATVEDVQTASTVMAMQASRVLAICTHELESPVFEYGPFVDAVKRFILGPRFSKVRVLVMDPGRVSYHRHSFILLARKLTSYIEIRNAAPALRGCPASFMIADRHATLYRLQSERWDGICDLQDRGVARVHLERFDALWHRSGVQRQNVTIRI
jgi:hypothetical protein